MRKTMKKSLLWCLVLLIIFTFQPISVNAAIKKTNLKAPVLSSWKKTWDGRWSTPPANGVQYTVTWNKVAGASGYQVKISTKEGNWSAYRSIITKKRSYSEAGSSIEQSKAKVRAYKIVKGKKQYGPWSKVKISGLWY